MILGTRFSILGTRIGPLKRLKKPDLHAPSPFAQIGQGYLTRNLCVEILLHLR